MTHETQHFMSLFRVESAASERKLIATVVMPIIVLKTTIELKLSADQMHLEVNIFLCY